MSEEEYNNLTQDERTVQDKIDWEATLEDHDMDDASLKRQKDKEDKEFEQYGILHDQLAKESYKLLYTLGCDKDEVRKKLEDLSKFMGEFGFSRLTNEQIGSINMWLRDLISLQYKFKDGVLTK